MSTTITVHITDLEGERTIQRPLEEVTREARVMAESLCRNGHHEAAAVNEALAVTLDAYSR